MAKRKWYVVFNGFETGVCETWDECLIRTKGYPHASYKSYTSLEEAIEAYRNEVDVDAREVLRTIAARSADTASAESAAKPSRSYADIPEIMRGSIAVDAACSGNPGVMEYRGVDIDTGRELFHQGPFPDATNNIGEFLAIVHALAMCYNSSANTAIYSDSVSGMAWVRRKKANTQLKRTARNERVFELIIRAEAWLNSHRYANPIYKWQTDRWGEIPADFGRK